MHPQTPMTYKQDNCRTNTPTDKDKNSYQYAYGQTRIRANMPMNTTPLLALHCHPNDPVTNTVLLPTQTMIVLICMRSID